ncbi:RDH11 dehydrogenase, partial [Acromyrmex charruanus]
KMWFLNKMCTSKVCLDDKTVVITGGNSGIGKETARDLYARGARVILVCRNMEMTNKAVEDIKNNPSSRFNKSEYKNNVGELAVYSLDLCSLKSVRDCAKNLLTNEAAIHILINNAGVYEKTEDGNEMTLQVNYLGHFLLTLLLLPKMQKSSPNCRIVNVSSLAHFCMADIDFDNINLERSYGPIKSYAQSKLANILFTKELARKLKGMTQISHYLLRIASIYIINILHVIHKLKINTSRFLTLNSFRKLPSYFQYVPLLAFFIPNALKNNQNMVYKISCDDCAANYVGQTKRKLSTRLHEHISDIKKNTGSSTAIIYIVEEKHHKMLRFSKYLFHQMCTSKARLDGKTIVITGANRGLGKETARDLYARGARVILACRNMERANKAVEDIKNNPPSRINKDEYKNNAGELAIYSLDLCSLKSVKDCAKNLLTNEAAIHILINNAGRGSSFSLEKTEDGNEMTLQVNHLSHFLLTLLLLPKMQLSSPNCRIINVSSIAHRFANIDFDDINLEKSYTPFKSYARTKLANILFTKELTNRLRMSLFNFGITCNSCCENQHFLIASFTAKIFNNTKRLIALSTERTSATLIKKDYKMWFFNKTCTSKTCLDGKTVVITGASDGIGKETARDLYARAANIHGINVYSLHPGIIPTKISRYGSSTIFSGVTLCYTLFAQLFCKDAKQGAQTTIYCCIDEEIANETGLYYSNCGVTTPYRKANQHEYPEKLWNVSCRLLHLEPEEDFTTFLETVSRQML